jgi:predicted Zn-dependent protease
VNAYAFPGGSIACTRGILLELDNEAELTALLGHELGHVNARHTAQQVSKSMLASMAVGSAAVFAGSGSSALGNLVGTLGGMGAGALLAKYSRDNERQADDLGMEYMVKANYSPKGMVGLMDMLKNQSKHKPDAFEMLFATHPMSDERYRTSVQTAETKYASAGKFPLNRERYMDNTARLRAQKAAIEAMQEGEKAMAKEDFRTAEKHFKKALEKAPNDYAGLVMMSKCQAALKKEDEARRYAKMAKKAYPEEAQAYYVSGALSMMKKDYEGAYQDFSQYESRLPGNPSVTFLKGYSLEGMGRKKEAAAEYNRYLKVVQQGEMAQYAYQRLVQWGYIK